MRLYLCFTLSALLFIQCEQSSGQDASVTNNNPINEDRLLIDRFQPPKPYTTQKHSADSFAHFLQTLPLKKPSAQVRYFNGGIKQRNGVYAAVVDLPIGERDLHQCADAIIRLRADYLQSQDREDEIGFHFTNGFYCDYATWKSGQRPSVNGNTVRWQQGNRNAGNYWKYLETVFAYAGTLSLSQEMTKKAIADIEIGDVFIRGGAPGHAIIVLNLAENATGEKVMMLAQSYMPAQELQILNNPTSGNVWYDVPTAGVLVTPEWTFKVTELKKF